MKLCDFWRIHALWLSCITWITATAGVEGQAANDALLSREPPEYQIAAEPTPQVNKPLRVDVNNAVRAAQGSLKHTYRADDVAREMFESLIHGEEWVGPGSSMGADDDEDKFGGVADAFSFASGTSSSDDSSAEGESSGEGDGEFGDSGMETLGDLFNSESPAGREIEASANQDEDEELVSSCGEVCEVRPSASERKPDVVEFGIYIKNFYGGSLRKKNFHVDSIITLKWKDERVKDIIPEGQDTMTMDTSQATASIWLPEIAITSRDILSHEKISFAYIASKDGTVTEFMRTLTGCKNEYHLENYPFDNQNMTMLIASSKYMNNELVLKPLDDTRYSGVEDNIFDYKGWHYKGHKQFAFLEENGMLKKSRGAIQIRVKGDRDGYIENHMMACVLYLQISWAVFWIPFVPAFSTPRVVMSILAILVFTQRMVITNSKLPLCGMPVNWHEIWNMLVGRLMASVIYFNVYTEFAFHVLKCETAARAMNTELKMWFPITATILLGFMLFTAYTALMSVRTCSIICDIMSIVLIGGFGFIWAMHLWRDMAKLAPTPRIGQRIKDAKQRISRMSSKDNLGASEAKRSSEANRSSVSTAETKPDPAPAQGAAGGGEEKV